jgi:peptidyl-prolyl cis-trans isomerase A (cyclophilin A)/peptidyl-prolyl cis-trans isomerase-like 1
MFRFCCVIGFVFAIALVATSSPKKLPGPPPVIVRPGVKYIASVQTSMGTFHVQLFSVEAPLTASNFIYLARANFFNGQTFHRIVPGHVIQGGDPLGTGNGDAGYTIPFEKSPHKHLEGSVGMARYGDDLNSASSQFYVCLAARPNLDGKYVVFGKVYQGMEVVQKIGRVATDANERPLKPVYIHRVIINEM